MVYLRSVLLLATFTILEVQVLARLRIFDVAAQLVLASAMAAGMTGGPDRGAAYGFAGGLFLDLYLPTPFGLSGFAFGISAYLIGFGAGRIVEESWLTRIGFVAVGSALATCIYVFGGEALGQSGCSPAIDDFLQKLGLIVAINAVLGIVLVPAVTWMWDFGWVGRERWTPR